MAPDSGAGRRLDTERPVTNTNAAAAKPQVHPYSTTLLQMAIAGYLVDDPVSHWLTTVTARLAVDLADVPIFGGAEWESASDAARLASALRAAEAWRREGLALPGALADQVAEARRAELEDARAWGLAAGLVSRVALAPDHGELVARRAVVTGPSVTSVPAQRDAA